MKYFCVSDIHGFYTELIAALKEAGYNKRNKDHVLIVAGDNFDRGFEAVKVYNFLRSIPKSRRVLIRGNHEYLYLKLLEKSFPDGHDFSNGTVDTFCQIAGQDYFNNSIEGQIRMADFLDNDGYRFFIENEEEQERHSIWEDIRNIVEAHEITKWLKSDEWKNYYELDNFIFVHSFIPVKSLDGLPVYYVKNRKQGSIPDWRNSSKKEWEDATWGCPFEQYKSGLFKLEEEKGKTLVCGHWHTSDFFKNLKQIHLYDYDCGPIYYSKGLIGLDGGCLYNYFLQKYYHPQNVLVIDNGKCYDKSGKELVELEEKVERIIQTVIIDKDGNELPIADDYIDKF